MQRRKSNRPGGINSAASRASLLSSDESGRFDELVGDLVIINLVINAFDAVGDIAGGPRKVTLTAMEAEGCAKLFVSDSGKGISPLAMQRIFEPFFTTKSGGMGMGLAISRSIVEAHGGRLSASSDVGRGATFEIALPSSS